MDPEIEEWLRVSERLSTERGVQLTEGDWHTFSAAAARWLEQNAGLLALNAQIPGPPQPPIWAADTITEQALDGGPTGTREGFISYLTEQGETPERAALSADYLYGHGALISAITPHLDPAITNPMGIVGFRAIASSPDFAAFTEGAVDGEWRANSLADAIASSRAEDAGMNRLGWMVLLTESYSAGLENRQALIGRMQSASTTGDPSEVRELVLERQSDRDRVRELVDATTANAGSLGKDPLTDLSELATTTAKWEGLDQVIQYGAREFDTRIQGAAALPSIAEVAAEREFFQGVEVPSEETDGPASLYDLSHRFETQVTAAAAGATQVADPIDAQSRVARLAVIGAELRKQTEGELTARSSILARLDAEVQSYEPARTTASPPQEGLQH